MTKLQRRARKKNSRRNLRERAGDPDRTSHYRESSFPSIASSSSPPATAPSRFVSLLSQLQPMTHLEHRFRRLSTHDSGQEWHPQEAAQANDVKTSLSEEFSAESNMDLPAELPTEFQTKVIGSSAEPPAEPPVELPAEPISKKPASLLSSPSLSSLFSWAPSSSSIVPTQETILEFEKSFHSSLPAIQILNTREPIPPHNVTEVFSVVRHKSTIIDTVSIFVMKHIKNDNNGSNSFVLSCPISLNDITSICKYPLRSSLSGSRTLYEVAIPSQVASALTAFEICNISYGDTVAEREVLPYTVSRMMRPFRANLVRKRDSTLYRYGRPLCESMLYALLNRNEVAARWFWEKLMRLTKISRQYAKAYHRMSSYVEDQLKARYSSDEEQVDSWGPEHSWLRFWIIDRVNPYKKFPISSLVNIDRGVEREFSSFVRSSSGWPAGYGDSSKDFKSSESVPYVHNIFTQASHYTDDNSSRCESEYFDLDQQPAEKSKPVLPSADQKDSGYRSAPIDLIDRIYSFWSYRARSARRQSARW